MLASLHKSALQRDLRPDSEKSSVMLVPDLQLGKLLHLCMFHHLYGMLHHLYGVKLLHLFSLLLVWANRALIGCEPTEPKVFRLGFVHTPCMLRCLFQHLHACMRLGTNGACDLGQCPLNDKIGNKLQYIQYTTQALCAN